MNFFFDLMHGISVMCHQTMSVARVLYNATLLRRAACRDTLVLDKVKVHWALSYERPLKVRQIQIDVFA